jgi:hypothetical protein
MIIVEHEIVSSDAITALPTAASMVRFWHKADEVERRFNGPLLTLGP